MKDRKENLIKEEELDKVSGGARYNPSLAQPWSTETTGSETAYTPQDKSNFF